VNRCSFPSPSVSRPFPKNTLNPAPSPYQAGQLIFFASETCLRGGAPLFHSERCFFAPAQAARVQLTPRPLTQPHWTLPLACATTPW
jgi:hypothetical protein